MQGGPARHTGVLNNADLSPQQRHTRQGVKEQPLEELRSIDAQLKGILLRLQNDVLAN